MGVGVRDASSTIHLLVLKSKPSSYFKQGDQERLRGSRFRIVSQSQHLPPRWCSKRQLVDLVKEGVWQELLDSGQIEICVADW